MMEVVTLVTDPEHPMFRRYLLPSCRHHGLPLQVLTTTRRIQTTRRERLASLLFRRELGFQHKDALLLDYLTGLPEERLVLFTDGYDTLFLAGPEEIEAKYHQLGHPLLFAAEANCHPDPRLAAAYPPATGPWPFLNTGAFMGRAGDLRRALTRVRTIPTPRRYAWSNQYRWSRLFLEHPDLIGLDHRARLFFCAAVPWVQRGTGPWDAEYWRQNLLDNGRIKLENDEMPCHLHFNGPIAARMEELAPVLASLCPWLSTRDT